MWFVSCGCCPPILPAGLKFPSAFQHTDRKCVPQSRTDFHPSANTIHDPANESTCNDSAGGHHVRFRMKICFAYYTVLTNKTSSIIAGIHVPRTRRETWFI